MCYDNLISKALWYHLDHIWSIFYALLCITDVQFSSVAQLCPTLRPQGLEHARLPRPSPTPRPAQTRVHGVGDPTISSSVAAAAAAKSLQLCPTLCDPIGSPPGSPIPRDSPGKNTGVGCHFLLQCMKVKSESEVAQSCPTRWTAAFSVGGVQTTILRILGQQGPVRFCQ